MATPAEIQDVASLYSENLAKALLALDELARAKSWYEAFDLGNNASFPADAFDGTLWEGRMTRDDFREIVVSAGDALVDASNAPGYRPLFAKLLNGIPR